MSFNIIILALLKANLQIMSNFTLSDC